MGAVADSKAVQILVVVSNLFCDILAGFFLSGSQTILQSISSGFL